MTPCQRFKDTLFDLLDHEIDPQRKKQLQNHIGSCPACARLLHRLQVLRSCLLHLQPVQASDTFQLLLRERLRREMKRGYKRSAIAPSGVVRWIPAVGLAAAMVVIGLMLRDRDGNQAAPSPPFKSLPVASGIMDPFRGQVQYVIGDYPQRISISRDDSKPRTTTMGEDTLNSSRDIVRTRPHVTPVSF